MTRFDAIIACEIVEHRRLLGAILRTSSTAEAQPDTLPALGASRTAGNADDRRFPAAVIADNSRPARIRERKRQRFEHRITGARVAIRYIVEMKKQNDLPSRRPCDELMPYGLNASRRRSSPKARDHHTRKKGKRAHSSKDGGQCEKPTDQWEISRTREA